MVCSVDSVLAFYLLHWCCLCCTDIFNTEVQCSGEFHRQCSSVNCTQFGAFTVQHLGLALYLVALESSPTSRVQWELEPAAASNEEEEEGGRKPNNDGEDDENNLGDGDGDDDNDDDEGDGSDRCVDDDAKPPG